MGVPPSINIFQHTLYCMGEGYLDRRSYNEAVTDRRVDMRLAQQLMDAEAQPPLFQAQVQEGPPPMAPMAEFVQTVAEMMAQPIRAATQAMSAFIQQLPGMEALRGALSGLTKLTSQLASLVGQIGAFFFGNKKDRTEEARQREQEEYPQLDIFTKRTVEETASGGMGGGGQ